jgi:hypothetical protein
LLENAFRHGLAARHSRLRANVQDSDPVKLPLLLRIGGERPGEGTRQRGQQEAAAVHYSMT